MWVLMRSQTDTKVSFTLHDTIEPENPACYPFWPFPSSISHILWTILICSAYFIFIDTFLSLTESAILFCKVRLTFNNLKY